MSVPETYKKFTERNFQQSCRILKELNVDLPKLNLKFEYFKNVGSIFSTSNATCSKCGSKKEVHADIHVITDPENPDGRIVTSTICCKACNTMFGWGFKIDGFKEEEK
ncbi:hypothetical protein KAR91_12380 [Candidatus Pacearchaeota archaeon]|nr:hypothetical protein [Candidatus Pacearchaeota archaeon]